MTTNPFKVDSPSNSIEFKIYPLLNDFIGNIMLPESNFVARKVETVIILDRSGSMGLSVPKIVNAVLPKFFANLSYEVDEFFSLISFETRTILDKIKIGTLPSVKVVSGGGTCMAPAVKKLHELFEELKEKEVQAVRILTISDGEIDDKKLTKEFGDELAEFAAGFNISINSQAVRFFTSSSSPDTTAICSLLQLNNIKKSNLTDITANEHDDIIADKMSQLFLTDGLDKMKTLENAQQIFLKFPWDENAFEKLSILPGENTFWLNEIPKAPMKINEILVTAKLELKVPINELLGTKMNFLVDRIKILKVINTKKAERNVEKILNYFKRIEELLVKNPGGNILGRVESFKALKAAAKDDKISELNNEQKAEYLRSPSEERKSSSEKIDLSYDEIAGEFKMAVVSLNYPQDFITQEKFEDFNNFLEDEIDKLRDEENLAPNFLNFTFENGYIVFECQGMHTVDFLKGAVEKSEFGSTLKVIAESEISKPVTFKTFTSEKKFSIENFLKRISRQNQGAGIDTSKWKVFDVISKENGTDLSVEVDFLSACKIRKTKFLFYSLSTIKFTENETTDAPENLSVEEMRLVGNADIYARKVASKFGIKF